MKYSAKKYAKALVDSMDSKVGDKKIVANFLQLLEKNDDMAKASQIMALAKSLLLKKTGNKKVVLETARKANVQEIAKAFVHKGDVLEEKINPDLIAGVKISVDGNRQLDLSLLSKLNNLF